MANRSLEQSREAALQDRLTPTNHCFGCGPASEAGLQLKSRVDGSHVTAFWQPHDKYMTTGRILSGGIISSLLECHSSWAVAVEVMNRQGHETAPTNLVTKEMTVRYRRPVPIVADSPVELRSVFIGVNGREWLSECELFWGDEVCARGRLTSVLLDV